MHTLGYTTASKRGNLSDAARKLIATYGDEDRKADIDWADPGQRAKQLKVLVPDAEAALDMALAHSDRAEVRSVGWLLTKILGDDIVTDQHADSQIGAGTAPDRIISISDPEMRHRRKSKAPRCDGFKVAIATEPETELILDVADIPASVGDGRHLVPTIERVKAHAGHRRTGHRRWRVWLRRELHGLGDHRGQAVDLVTPSQRPNDPEVAISAFTIGVDQRTVACPVGQTARGVWTGANHRPIMRFTFARAACEACRLFAR